MSRNGGLRSTSPRTTSTTTTGIGSLEIPCRRSEGLAITHPKLMLGLPPPISVTMFPPSGLPHFACSLVWVVNRTATSSSISSSRGSAKERREALDGLRRSGGADIVGDAWEAATAADDPNMAKRVLFQLVPMADRWLRISIGLQAVANADPDVAGAGVDVLQRTLVDWNRGYPTKPTIDAGVLREQFENARPMLHSRDRRRFRWGLEAEVQSLLPAE